MRLNDAGMKAAANPALLLLLAGCTSAHPTEGPVRLGQIAAVNGPAVGVGVTMTLPADVRLASTTAKFGLVFARRGIVPEAASSWFLPRVVGTSQAAEWCYSGRVFPATEAADSSSM